MDDEDVFIYAADEVKEYSNRSIPKWLMITYIILPLICAAIAYLYWGGSWGWLDRGHWYELQQAAKTTFPLEKRSDMFDDGSKDSQITDSSF